MSEVVTILHRKKWVTGQAEDSSKRRKRHKQQYMNEEMFTIPFQTIDWSSIEKVENKGEAGVALSQTIQFAGLRIRMVEYSKGYFADHWCQKGHIVHCLEGEFVIELGTGEKVQFQRGESFVVSDEISSHRSISVNGAQLLIIDGDFLNCHLSSRS